MMFGIIAILAINITDTYFVGLLGTDKLAAISFTFPVVFTMGSFSIGLGAGTASVVSRAFGANNESAVKIIATHSLLLSFLCVLVLAVAGYATVEELFYLLGARGEILKDVCAYMRIFFIGVPFLIIPMVANSLIRASGNTTIPSLIMISAAICNIILDPLLIFGYWGLPELGIEGAAWASVISRILTFFLAFGVVILKERMLTFNGFNIPTILDSWKQVLVVGLPAAGGNMINPMAIGFVTKVVSTFGSDAVAAFGVATRVEALFNVPLFALSAALSPFAGQNFGGKKLERIVSALKYSGMFSVVWAGFVFLIMLIFGADIVALFTTNEYVISQAHFYLQVVSFTLFGYGILIVNASAFNAMGLATTGMTFYLLRAFIFYIPTSYIGSLLFDLPGIFYGIALGNVAAGLIIFLKTKLHFNRVQSSAAK